MLVLGQILAGKRFDWLYIRPAAVCSQMYRFDVFVPTEHFGAVREAVFSAKGGAIGQYQRCCFSVTGTGQFMPLQGSAPFIGCANQDQYVYETLLSFVVGEEYLEQVIAAIKASHPYEEPAFQYWLVNVPK